LIFATSSADADTSEASTRAFGNVSASRMARQPEPVHRSSARRGARASQGRRRSRNSSAMNERGTIARSSA